LWGCVTTRKGGRDSEYSRSFNLSLAGLVWSRAEPAVFILQSGNLPGFDEWITGGMSSLLSVGLNCTHCFIMMFCISKIVRNGVLALNLGNYFLLQVIQFLAVCDGVIILLHHLWRPLLAPSCVSVRPSEYITSAPTGLSLISAEKIGQKHVSSH